MIMLKPFTYISNLFAKKKFKIKDIKHTLLTKTNAGHWNFKPHYNPFTACVTIHGICDRVYINAITGFGYYTDLDDDCMMEDESCPLVMKQLDNGEFKLFKRRVE